MKKLSKTLLTVLLLAMAALPWGKVCAQTDPTVRKQVEAIRKAYAQAKKDIEQNDSEDFYDKNDMLLTSNYEALESNRRETIHYYFKKRVDEHTSAFYYQPYFIVRQFNLRDRMFYEEYLFEGEGPTLTFVFNQWTDLRGNKIEERYYYNFHGPIWKMLKGTNKSDELRFEKKSQELISAFNSVMNMDY
jgi:hypothetical protein